jgi:tRNA(His) 5'-end guanylyltransferase
MDATAVSLCKAIQGAQIGYVQSDEISLLLTDFDNVQTDAWFNGNLQKIVSISAAMATMAFSSQATVCGLPNTVTFDARAFTIPDREEVMNYFVWRQQDATRNSVQMVAQSLYSHKELHGKNNSELQEMIHAKGQNWDAYPPRHKRGAAIVKTSFTESRGFTPFEGNERHWWVADKNTPIFTQHREYLNERTPTPGY